MEWLKWHVGSVNDPKFRIVARKVREAGLSVSTADVIAVWAGMLEHAATSRPLGSIRTLESATIAEALDLAVDKVSAILEAMHARGLITDADHLAGWARRQAGRIDHTNANRQRAYRLRKRQAESGQQDTRNGVTRGPVDPWRSGVTALRAPQPNNNAEGEHNTPPHGIDSATKKTAVTGVTPLRTEHPDVTQKRYSKKPNSRKRSDLQAIDFAIESGGVTGVTQTDREKERSSFDLSTDKASDELNASIRTQRSNLPQSQDSNSTFQSPSLRADARPREGWLKRLFGGGEA